MSTVMGTIKAVIGQVWIVGANGTQRQAIEGEVLLRGEEVVTGQGAVTLTLPDGKNLDLGRASTWSGNSAESSTQDLAAAQQAIAQGGDPTQILEATAAGTPTAITEDAGDGGGGHSSVVLDLTGQILDPTAGYPTSGIDAAFTGPLEEQTLIYTAADPGSDANLPPVAPPVTPPVPPVTPPVNPPEPPVTPPEPPVKPPLPQASITLDAIATDNILNMKEAAEPTTLVSGTTGHDVKPGDTVTVTVNGNEYSTVVGEEGRWSVEVNTNDLLASGDVEANVTTRDEHGNEATANAQGSVGQATLSVKITIDPIGGDGYLNNAELKEESTTLSGRVSEGTPEGTEITLTMDGRPIGTATVNHDGTWSTTVETSLIKDGGKVQAEISLSDKYGNEVDAKAEAKVEPRPLSVEITIDTIGGDGYLNNAELSEKLTAISGTVSKGTPEGTEITLTMDGRPIGTATVNDDGTWSTTVETSLIKDGGEVTAEISLSDEYGNEVGDKAFTTVVPTPLDVEITIDTIGGDGFLNNAELSEKLTAISGTVSKGTPVGTEITLTMDGRPIGTATVNDDGTWSTTVETSLIKDGGEVTAEISLSDEYGNEVGDKAEATVEPRPLSVEITIDTIGGDGFLNNAELSEKLTTISGTVSEGTPEGTEITLTMDGRPIGTATVNSDGTWSTAVETSLIKDGGEVTAEISLSDEYDNEVGDKAFTTVVPTPLDVEITIDDVTGDNFLSFAETNQLPGEDAPTIKVTGTVSGNAAEGDYINVTVGDVTHTVKVQKDGEGKLVWEAEFTAENLMKNPEVSASIEIRDDYGNVVNDSALTTVNVEMGNLITGNEHDNVLEGGDETSDLIIADTQGFQQQPGQDYNIAFIVDTSGSVNSGDIKSIIASLTKVFNSLHQNAQFDSSGKVNILLVDFDTQVNFAVSVDLRDPNALKTLTDALAKMTSGGGTNYEDAFKTTANWFHEVGGEGSENLTYFITDGKPTYYQTGEKSLIDVDSRSGSSNVVTLDLSTLNYTAGQVVTMKIAGHERVVIDAQGNVYSWNASDRQNVGVLRADGKGGYELSTLGGAGSSTSSTTTSNAHSAFLLLMGVCNNVEAIGINNGISANDLKPYDSDGNVMSGIAADKLAEAILGGDNVQMAGAQDTVHGNAGNDILFGDMVLFGGSSGFDAMKAYVADKLGVDASKLGVSHISQYIAEHPEEFDQSQNDGGKDVLFGGLGDDILYGGGGSDLLVGGSGDDLLFGGKGDDILLGDGYESASKLAEAMNTTVGKLTFEGVSDFISQNSDVLGGLGSGNDKLYGGEGKDLLIGGGGHDLLNGGDGNDLLFGGTGNDVLIGGKGNDMLIGGAGQDAFTWLKGDDGHDVIKDFNAKEGDRIDLSELLGGNIDNNLADYIQVSQNSNGDAVININTDGQMQSQGSTMSITVEGSSMADINSLLASPDNTAIIL